MIDDEINTGGLTSINQWRLGTTTLLAVGIAISPAAARTDMINVGGTDSYGEARNQTVGISGGQGAIGDGHMFGDVDPFDDDDRIIDVDHWIKIRARIALASKSLPPEVDCDDPDPIG